MKSTLFLFLLQGLICFLSNKGSLCTPLHEKELLNGDDLDNNQFTEDFGGLTYRDDDDFVLKGADQGESAAENLEEEGGAGHGEPEEGHEGGRAYRYDKKDDEKDKTKGYSSKNTGKEKEPSKETPGSTKLVKDASTGSSSKPSEDVHLSKEREEEEEGDEYDESRDVDLQDYDSEYSDDEEEDDDEDEEYEEEIDKSEHDNNAAGGAKVSYQEVKATNTHIPTKYLVNPENTKVSEGGLVEDVAQFPDPPPQVTNLVNSYNSWMENHPIEAPTKPAPFNVDSTQTSRPRKPDPFSQTTLTGNTGGTPIILPIVFVPFDVNTNRVNFPGQFQSQGAMSYPPQSQLRPAMRPPAAYPQPAQTPLAEYLYQQQYQPAPRPAAEQLFQYVPPPPSPRPYIPNNYYAQPNNYYAQSPRSKTMKDLELLVVPAKP